ncbi:MAG TPA: AAA family ATPase, partial [Gaiellales bacterium]|nr:AAA family ATPase [Gaiellales bacterium]
VPYPLHEVGALLDAKALHPSRSARNHLLALAKGSRISPSRVDVVLEMVGLSDVASRSAGKFSLGMGQRLGIAAALLGDPPILMFDEPVNGLDPEGIRWIRNLLRSLAAEGRTIFVSSHLMSEMSMMADWLIVVGRGKLIADTTVEGFVKLASGDGVRVRTPDAARMRSLTLAIPGVTLKQDDEEGEDGVLSLQGISCETVGELAAANNIVLHELSPEHASLEEAFMRLTLSSVEYHAAPPAREEPVGAAR